MEANTEILEENTGEYPNDLGVRKNLNMTQKGVCHKGKDKSN